MASQVTQCPNCKTSFRVTEVQLNVANGMVRCGSCLHIFNAADHWLTTPSTEQETENLAETTHLSDQEPDIEVSDELESIGDDELINDTTELSSLDESPGPSPEASPDTSLDDIFDDDLFADDDLDLLADEMRESHQQSEQPLEEELSAAQNVTGELFGEQESTDATGIAMSSEFQALDSDDLIIDESELVSDTTTQTIINTDDDLDELIDDDIDVTDGDFSDSFLDLDKEEENPLAVFKELDEIGEDDGLEEEDWARKLLEEEVEEHTPVAQEEEAPNFSEATTTAEGVAEEPDDAFSDLFETLEEDQVPLDPELLDILNERDNGEKEASAPEDEFVLGGESLMAGERIGFDKTDLLANIEPEPVELDIASRRNLWAKRAWAASIVLAALLLVAQHIAFNFDRLARDNSYRPLFTSICSVFGCQVPALYDTRLIRSSNLMVRSHPELKHALVVDAIIINRADFKQQFPVMELQFTDIDGGIVAGRRFNPEEYLAGELSGTTNMPTKQPIHISLEIVDPGEQAVNYQLRFYPKQGS